MHYCSRTLRRSPASSVSVNTDDTLFARKRRLESFKLLRVTGELFLRRNRRSAQSLRIAAFRTLRISTLRERLSVVANPLLFTRGNGTRHRDTRVPSADSAERRPKPTARALCPSGPTSVAWRTSLETAPGAASYRGRDNIIETAHPHAPKSGRIAPDTEENNGKLQSSASRAAHHGASEMISTARSPDYARRVTGRWADEV